MLQVGYHVLQVGYHVLQVGAIDMFGGMINDYVIAHYYVKKILKKQVDKAFTVEKINRYKHTPHIIITPTVETTWQEFANLDDIRQTLTVSKTKSILIRF